jgi:hypothetical protein
MDWTKRKGLQSKFLFSAGGPVKQDSPRPPNQIGNHRSHVEPISNRFNNSLSRIGFLVERSNAMGDAAAEQFSFSDWILVDPSNAMAAAAAAASPEGSGDENAHSVLLDVKAYSGASKNASTARSKTSTGHTIEVTFCTVPPPALSHVSVHCPGLQLPAYHQTI